MLQAVIFDIDGVLVDSREANIVKYKQLFIAAGYSEPSREAILGVSHLPLKQSVTELLGITDEKELDRIREMAKRSELRATHLFTFPASLVADLEKLHKKYRLAVVTGRSDLGIQEVFGAAAIGHLFEVTVGFGDYKNPKPHPEPLHVALEKLKISADEAIYIGDSATDIEAAHAAGMRSIYLSSASHPDASAVIGEFKELERAIESLVA